jgi:Protein of unknown function (DUF3551)
MRAVFFTLMAIGTAAAIDVTPAAARDLPFCMRSVYGDDDCSYYNYQQCAVTASGQGTTCFANPALAYGAPPYAGQLPPPRRQRYRSAY